MDGVLVAYKPTGCTSCDVVVLVKRKIRAKKVGHLGTLDPLARGVLPLVINAATRYAGFLGGGIKKYLSTMKLGETTDTYDSEGRTVEFRPVDVSANAIRSVLGEFTGVITQTPPVFSAVKVGGAPLYKLARRGIFIKPEPKTVEVYSMEIKELAIPYVTMEVQCSAGTYIRTLVHDVGRRLGCGAHLTALTRTRSGRFTAQDAIDPHWDAEMLIDKIIPLEGLIGQDEPPVSGNASTSSNARR
jgi:tRNA pseudouridine55 synthase